MQNYWPAIAGILKLDACLTDLGFGDFSIARTFKIPQRAGIQDIFTSLSGVKMTKIGVYLIFTGVNEIVKSVRQSLFDEKVIKIIFRYGSAMVDFGPTVGHF